MDGQQWTSTGDDRKTTGKKWSRCAMEDGQQRWSRKWNESSNLKYVDLKTMDSTTSLCFTLLITVFLTSGQEEETNTNHIYREEYETYETLQRHSLPHPQVVEFAETEYRRPSFYLSVPFRSQNKLQTIPATIFSELIRQHIARNRMKLLNAKNSQNNNALQVLFINLVKTNSFPSMVTNKWEL
ncbi:hypothetical protein ACQ4LE_003463 [Meloidogyne hapla]